LNKKRLKKPKHLPHTPEAEIHLPSKHISKLAEESLKTQCIHCSLNFFFQIYCYCFYCYFILLKPSYRLRYTSYQHSKVLLNQAWRRPIQSPSVTSTYLFGKIGTKNSHHV